LDEAFVVSLISFLCRMHDPALESNKRVKTNARVYFERVQRALFAVAADPNAFDALNVR